MAPKTPVSLSLTEVMGSLYVGAMGLVEVDRAITPEELQLTNQLMKAVELARLTDYSRRAAIAQLNGWGATNHQARLARELEQDLANFRAEHEARIARLRSDITRIAVPLPRNMTARECQSQTA